MSTTAELRSLTAELARVLQGGPHEQLAAQAQAAATDIAETLEMTNRFLGYVHDEVATACCRPSQPQIAERPRQSA